MIQAFAGDVLSALFFTGEKAGYFCPAHRAGALGYWAPFAGFLFSAIRDLAFGAALNTVGFEFHGYLLLLYVTTISLCFIVTHFSPYAGRIIERFR